jgi:hypothetical protein
MQRETGFVVVVLGAVVVALVVLAVYLARLRARVRRLERKATPAEVQARLVAVEQVQTRLAFEVQTQARLAAAARSQGVAALRALRDELTIDPDPPMYAPRSEPMRPPARIAPLAHPDLIGSEDIADEAARRSLGPEEPTPPRGARAAPRMPAVQGALVQLELEHAEMRASLAREVLSSRLPRAKDPA